MVYCDNQPRMSFQEMIASLQNFWAQQGCAIVQPYDLPVGAGTSHPLTLLRALGQKPWRAAFVQPCRRPGDGRYGKNPNRTQHYYQFQVIVKPAPINPQDLYLQSLDALGLLTAEHDIRFVEDDWENPSLGASGLGWEIWCDGKEISQFTYFQYVGGISCNPVSVEITYGLERIATVVQKVESLFDLNWNGQQNDERITYGDVFLENERQFSAFNFKAVNSQWIQSQFNGYVEQCINLVEQQLPLPAFDYCLQANHALNLLDACGAITVSERASMILRVRHLAKICCENWVEYA